MAAEEAGGGDPGDQRPLVSGLGRDEGGEGVGGVLGDVVEDLRKQNREMSR